MAAERERHESRLLRWAKSAEPGSAPIAAATVILVRDGREGVEALMLRRNSKIAFGGMWVFPGGRVDDEDVQTASSDDDLGAARCAAVREAREEASVDLSEDDLVTYSHWTPPAVTPKRFLTWFFVAPAPETEVVVDGGEIREHAWLSPTEALRQHDAQEIELAPPTWVTLWELERHTSVGALLAALADHSPERFETHVAIEEHGPTALWHGDAGYEESDASRAGPRHRLSMHKAGWRYERTRE